MRVAIGTAPGSFSDMSARANGHVPSPWPGFDAAAAAVLAGDADAVWVPVENSDVGPVVDAMNAITSWQVLAEAWWPIHLHAWGVGSLDDAREVQSHPVALAQSRGWIEAQRLRRVEAPDTSSAARAVASEMDHVRIALAPEGDWGLNLLARDVQAPGSRTRFVLAVPATPNRP